MGVDSVSVIVPQRGQTALTAQCLDRLIRTEPACEVVVVDDGTEPEEYRRWLRKKGAFCTTLRIPARGITRAWNAGIRQSRGATIVLLNNDVVCEGAWAAPLCQALEQPGVVIAGAADRGEATLQGTGLSGSEATRLLQGWCLAFRRETWEVLGGFDEAMSLYWSDTDFQRRAAQHHKVSLSQALRVVSVPLRHWGHRTAQHREDRQACWRRDRDAYHRKWALS